MGIDHQRAGEILLDTHQAMQCLESKRLNESVAKLLDTLVGIVPWDWRYNATYWAMDVADVCAEIGFSVASMRAFAKLSEECDRSGRQSSEGRVSYYADNAATRISSCRDKLALLAWSYYCPFNPDKKEEVLTFEMVRKRFRSPIKFGLRLQGHEEFLAELNKLVGKHFDKAIEYRHKKVHRMEPRVMLRKPENPDQRAYLFPLVTEDECNFDAELSKKYPEDAIREAIREGCFIDGVLFDRRAPGQLLWHFEEFDQFTHACWKDLCDAAAGSCEVLLGREPLLSKNQQNESDL